MTKRFRIALVAVVGIVIALLAALLSGSFDGLLRQALGPAADAPSSSDVVATPVDPAAPEAPGADVAERVIPVFDLIRVEPSGEAVISGQGSPNADVEILANGDVVATGKVNSGGDWAIALEQPLDAGAHDITVRTKAGDGSELLSEQSVAVAVPEGGSGEVLVVLNQPGTAATVLQIPAEGVASVPETQPEPEVAALEPAAPDISAADASAPDTVAPDAAVPAADAQPAEAPAEAPTADAATDMAATQVPAVVDAAGTAADLPPSSAEAVTSGEPAPAEGASSAEPAPAPSGGGETTVVAVLPDPATSQPEQPVAGGSTVEPAPDAASEATPGGAEPAGIEIATAPAEAAETPRLPISIEAVELENGRQFFAAGAAEPGAVIRLYVDDQLTEETRSMTSGRWLVEAEVPLQPGPHRVRADEIGSDGSVVARAEVPFEIADEPLSAPSLVSGEGSATAGSGTAGEARLAEGQSLIIRRGDNLWRIARRLYGSGIRYSTIYQANTDQIVNPDLIYPGQVFVIPKGDRNWEETTVQ